MYLCILISLQLYFLNHEKFMLEKPPRQIREKDFKNAEAGLQYENIFFPTIT